MPSPSVSSSSSGTPSPSESALRWVEPAGQFDDVWDPVAVDVGRGRVPCEQRLERRPIEAQRRQPVAGRVLGAQHPLPDVNRADQRVTRFVQPAGLPEARGARRLDGRPHRLLRPGALREVVERPCVRGLGVVGRQQASPAPCLGGPGLLEPGWRRPLAERGGEPVGRTSVAGLSVRPVAAAGGGLGEVVVTVQQRPLFRAQLHRHLTGTVGWRFSRHVSAAPTETRTISATAHTGTPRRYHATGGAACGVDPKS